MRLFQLIWQLIQAAIFNRAMNEDIPDDVCVACESADLTMLAPSVYRCNTCGYEGGSGYADWKKSQRRAQVEQLDGPARQQRIAENLAEASQLASSARGTFQSARNANIGDVVGIGASGGAGGEGYEAQQEMTTGFRYLFEAYELIEEAAHLAGLSVPPNLEIVDQLGFSASALDTQGDFLLADINTARKISEATECARRIEQWAQQRLNKTEQHAGQSW